MSSVEKLEVKISAVMEAVMEAAVRELRKLLDQCSGYWTTTAAGQRSSPAVNSGAGRESRGTLPEDKQQLYARLTARFASLMSAWTKGAAEKILVMLKMSLHDAADGPAAEQSAGFKEKTVQESEKLKAGIRVATPKKKPKCSPQKTKGGLQSALKQGSDHLYHRVEHQPEGPSTDADDPGPVTEPDDTLAEMFGSESPSEHEAPIQSNSDSNERAEKVIQKEAETSAITPKNTKEPSRLFQCPSCDKSFTRKCMMDRHFLSHSRPHLCTECGKSFSVLRGLNAHLRRHTGEKPYKCSECGTRFAHKSTFVRHMRRHSLRKPNSHTCSLCEGQFSGALAFQRHQCSALKKTFVCSLCPETFKCRQSLADHENQHSGERDFVCEMCGDCFFSALSLATHRVTHIQKQSCCDLLGLGCSDISVLQSHLSKHTGEKRFTCEVCGKGCSHRSALKHHMLTHTGERSYVCETCGKRCSHASALQNHMRIHTGRKPGQQSVCDVCGKKFSSAVNLKYHMSVHTGERPYVCDQCDKKFSNPSNLRVHMMIHTGEKMYGCNVCRRRFTQAYSLKLHRRVHTGEKPYSCQVCGEGFMNRGLLNEHQRDHLQESPGGGPCKKTVEQV